MTLHEITLALDECFKDKDSERFFKFKVEQDKMSLDFNIAIQYNIEINNCKESDPQLQTEPKIAIDFEHMILAHDVTIREIVDKIDTFVAELPEINYI